MQADADDEFASIAEANGYFEARFERRLAHDQPTVWQVLTNPARFVDWLAPGAMELRPGGRVKLTFADSGTTINSSVRACDAPRLLEYSWSDAGEPERPVRFETSSDGNGTQLYVTVRIPDDEDIARTCAGWEAHLAMLAAALAGAPIEFPFAVFQRAREAYKSRR